LAVAQHPLDRLINANIRGVVTDEEAAERLPEHRAERDRIKIELQVCEQPPTVMALPPSAVDDYLNSLDRLADVMNENLALDQSEAARVLRQLIERVTIIPALAGTAPTIEVSGRLETLLDLPTFAQGSVSGDEW